MSNHASDDRHQRSGARQAIGHLDTTIHDTTLLYLLFYYFIIRFALSLDTYLSYNYAVMQPAGGMFYSGSTLSARTTFVARVHSFGGHSIFEHATYRKPSKFAAHPVMHQRRLATSCLTAVVIRDPEAMV